MQDSTDSVTRVLTDSKSRLVSGDRIKHPELSAGAIHCAEKALKHSQAADNAPSWNVFAKGYHGAQSTLYSFSARTCDNAARLAESDTTAASAFDAIGRPSVESNGRPSSTSIDRKSFD